MNAPATQSRRLQPATCPLLAAVLPLRYAIGPIETRNPTTLDAATLGLPALNGNFPEMGPEHAALKDRPLGYVPRALRDGWLYVWEDSLQALSEYRVDAAMLKPTARSAPAPDTTTRAYLMLEAGAPVLMAWSPIRWSADVFAELESQPAKRQRMMRSLTPGVAPFSGSVQAMHGQIGDLKTEHYTWSIATRKASYWLLQDPPLKPMQRCEQQHFALVDDPWGVLGDLAALVRERRIAFTKLNKHRNDEWATAELIQSVADSDDIIRSNLASMIDVPQLQKVLKQPALALDALDADLRRLTECWARWFETLEGGMPSHLDSACAMFDLTQPDQRDLLEIHFACSCLGPSATPLGVKTLERELDVAQTREQPWLLWSLLGATRKIDPGTLKQALHLPEALADVTDAPGAAARLARATAFATAVNLAADQVQALNPARGGDPLFAVLSPSLGGRLRSLSEQIHPLVYSLMIASLVRSDQRLEVDELSRADAIGWLNEQIDQAHNKGQLRRLKKQLKKEIRNQARAAREAVGLSTPAKTPTATQVEEAIPHLRVVPASEAAPPHPAPGYGSDAPRAPGKPGTTLPPLSGKAARLSLGAPRNISELLNEAPLKTLIAFVSVWNLAAVAYQFWESPSARSALSTASAGFAALTAGTAVLQQLADAHWEAQVAQAGAFGPASRKLLADALGLGAGAMLLQAITAGLDVFIYGWQALDAYRAGDLDTAAVSLGLAGANLAYARVSLQAMRALRLARTAVLAGESTALATGIRVLTLPLRLSLVGLVGTILIGMVSLLYTKDTPLESWLKQTRFGTRPADWSGSLTGTLEAFWRIVLPVSLKLERWNDINPRTGQWVNEIRLVLHLPGQTEYQQGMITFSGYEEWERSHGLLDDATLRCIPLTWGEDDPIPFDPDIGSPHGPQSDGIRLRRAYHDGPFERLVAIRGSLTYTPVEGLSLPAIDIEVS
ncbi:toxin VasX [Metapseudomonas otitidis]|uniref:toxin VasX n=1 Tax=Metapseudomonas otitidis TaxID=319939 RepID=UPI0013F606C8|nr:toxin VasX [Pseudomonas otitidis]